MYAYGYLNPRLGTPGLEHLIRQNIFGQKDQTSAFSYPYMCVQQTISSTVSESSVPAENPMLIFGGATSAVAISFGVVLILTLVTLIAAFLKIRFVDTFY